LNELKLTNTENHDHYCNFITPPSTPKEDFPGILIIDAEWNDIEDIVLWCRTKADQNYNIFIYNDTMWDLDWFGVALAQCDTIILNTVESAIDDVKMKMAAETKTWHYGPRKFAGSKRKIIRPVDWFLKLHE
jgi:hypothetical protein